jgi:hypothetical protein
MNKVILSIISILFLTGCAGSVNYTKPVNTAKKDNSIIINKPIDVVWKNAVPELGKQFFVINNLDKSSGLINISYTGDPEKYIDCGHIRTSVTNLRGTRNYDFPASRANQYYEIMNNAGGLYQIQRSMSLDGRMNLVFEELSKGQTRVTANTKYVVTKNFRAQEAGGNRGGNSVDTISFNSGGSANFPADRNGGFSTCMPTGAFEKDVLSIFN